MLQGSHRCPCFHIIMSHVQFGSKLGWGNNSSTYMSLTWMATWGLWCLNACSQPLKLPSASFCRSTDKATSYLPTCAAGWPIFLPRESQRKLPSKANQRCWTSSTMWEERNWYCKPPGFLKKQIHVREAWSRWDLTLTLRAFVKY